MAKINQTKLTEKDNPLQFEIPVEGSLGLLAMGAVGIREWRKVRNAHYKSLKSKGEKE